MSDTLSVPREPWLAASWSSIWPGLGQVYAGVPGRGAAFALGYTAFLAVALAAVVTEHGSTLVAIAAGALGLAVYAASMVDAFRRVRAQASPEFEAARHAAKDTWKAVFLDRFVPGVGHFYAGDVGGLVFLLAWLFLMNASSTWMALAGTVIPVLAVADAWRRSRGRAGGTSAQAMRFCGALAAITLAAVLVTFFVRTNLVRAYRMPSESMLPTLHVGDAFYVDMARHGRAEHGDVVVFPVPGKPAIEICKRVLGLPGDVVEFRADSVLVNGVLVRTGTPPPFADFAFAAAGRPFQVPEGMVFAVGDNLANSLDSRFFGPVPLATVRGRAYHLYWPPGRSGPLPGAPGVPLAR